MKFLKFTLTVIVLGIGFICKGQHSEKTVVGEVRDEKSGHPIPYANIYFKSGKNSGAVSNEKGHFKISFPTAIERDSIFISFVGYNTFKAQVEKGKLLDSLHVSLKEQQLLLQSVEVLGLTPFAFLKQAAKNTTDNLASPANLNCYYREFISKNGQFTKFADASVDYYVNKGKKGKLEVDVKVLESRAKHVPVLYEGTKTMGDINLPQPLDVESLPRFFDATKMLDDILGNGEDNVFDLFEVSDNDGNEFYKIIFIPKEGIEKRLYMGELFVHKETSILHSARYILPDSHKQFAKKHVLPFGLKAQLSAQDAYVQYQTLGETVHLKYVKHSAGLHVFNSKGYDLTHVFSNEMLVNDIDYHSPQKIDAQQKWRKKSIYKHGNNYISKFWEGKSGLLATEEEEKIIESLNTI